MYHCGGGGGEMMTSFLSLQIDLITHFNQKNYFLLQFETLKFKIMNFEVQNYDTAILIIHHTMVCYETN